MFSPHPVVGWFALLSYTVVITWLLFHSEEYCFSTLVVLVVKSILWETAVLQQALTECILTHNNNCESGGTQALNDGNVTPLISITVLCGSH